MARVLVVDYGSGNVDSVRRALEECGAVAMVGNAPEDFLAATHIVLPGVGAFPDGMARLEARSIPSLLRHHCLEGGTPLLGICLGMQLLADVGSEVRPCAGLGLVPGSVDALVPDHPGERLPHVGWNEVRGIGDQPLLEGIPEGTDFYFVHSFHLRCASPEHLAASTPYCGGFASVVRRGNVHGTQFHPEKSQRAGRRLLQNFLGL